MKFPQDIHKIRKDFKELKQKLEYRQDLKDALAWRNNPLLFYKQVEPDANQFLCSLHNHTDGGNYELEDIARVGAINGYRIMAVTNHRRDYQFEGNRVLYNKDFDIYLIRGMECRCEENLEHKRIRKRFSLRKLQYKFEEEHGEENDVILVGYRDSIKDFQPFEETIRLAREQNALIIGTAVGNRYAKGPSIKRMLSIKDYFDAVEIFDSNHVLKMAAFDVIAKHFAMNNNLAGIYANDAHTLREIGCAGIGLFEKDYMFLDNPMEVVNNPDLLIEALRNSLRQSRFTNYGYKVPIFSFLYPSKAISLVRDAIIRPFDKSSGSWVYKD
jgi:predicted metal-dependent phosphoesterase TrpH